MGFSVLFPIFLTTCFVDFLVYSYVLETPYESCSYPSFESCSPYGCNDSIIKYPFGNCKFNVECPSNLSTLLNDAGLVGFCPGDRFRVLGGITESSYTSRTIRVACDDNVFDVCSASANSNSVSVLDKFYLSDGYKWGTILTCETEPSYGNNLQRIKCLECRGNHELCFFLPSSLDLPFYQKTIDDGRCNAHYGVVIPGNKSYNISDEKNLRELLETGFEIKWNISDKCPSCQPSGGICYKEYNSGCPTMCICPQGLHKHSCSDGKPHNLKKWWMTSRYKAVIGVLSGLFVTVAITFIYIRINRKKREQQEEEQDIREYMDPLDSRSPSVENFLHGGVPTRYSYRQIKRYTVNFAERLGQGGFGTVFKGTLPNGCMVAIKILDNSKHSGSQFMNEVVTIGRIHHLHLVRLLGYCFEGSKRALIYEYMVNGSLEKYIHGDHKNVLDWKQLYSIAMGTARGIAYLHDDCRSRILHCDIKPHNVLLDANFSPKVADFGLAKLTDREESHVSLTGARGTPGYVAPEVWSSNYGPVSDRSDVYGYGMLVMEMVGGRKNFDMKASRSSKFDYAEWAFKQVGMGEFQKLRGESIGDDEDVVMAKKLSLLGLWCIQYNPCQRPSMSRVIQMLEGTIDITIPPQPFPMDTVFQITASTESSSSM